MAGVNRLFQYFKPTRYELELTPDKQHLSFKGSVIIQGFLASGSSTLQLHSKGLEITKVTINGLESTFLLKPEVDELVINLAGDVNGRLAAKITFSGNITKQMSGLYPCYGRDGEVILGTQFESHHAREVFPCIDEPEAKAVFALTLMTPKDEVVLANTLPKTTSQDELVTTTVFEDTPPMSTYLLAFVVGKLESQESTTKDGILVRAWATPDQAKFTAFALDVAVKSLEFYHDYFEVAYPLAKCDVVALPDFAAGAMENWGLLTFRETCMLVEPTNTSLDNKQYVAMVVAHEVAHQWFGNLVTMRWWNDLWLNEGFASWIEYMAVDKLFPDWHMWTQFIASEQLAALRLDGLKNTHAIEVDVPHPDEIHTIFDSISYAKGACMIHMLNSYLGKNNFRLGLAHYLKKYAYKNTVTADLWEALAEVSHLPVAEFMGAWTSQIGFPYLTLDKNGSEIKITQNRFLSNGDHMQNPPIWPVPLLAADIKDKILNSRKMTVQTDNNGLHLNLNQAGFYITKYWPDAYKNITERLNKDSLSEVERIGLIADSLALTKAGHLPANYLLDILSALPQETSSPVWDGIATVLGDMRHILGNDVKHALKPFTKNLVSQQLARLGWHKKAAESHFDTLLRPLILGLSSGADNQEVVAEAKRIFDDATSLSGIDSDLRNMVLASVSHRGGKAEYQKMFGMLKTATSPEDMVVLAHGMTNFRQPTEYMAALKLIKSEHVKLQNISYWIVYALGNPKSRDATWDWIKENWGWLKSNVGSDMIFTRLPMYVAKAFCQDDFLPKYKEFFESVHEPAIDRSIKQGIESIKLQVAWKKRDEQVVLDWLKNNAANL